MNRTITIETALAASPERVWAHATSMPGANREMMPWLRMTYPSEAAGLDLSDARVKPGERLFVSWVLLFGVLPMERWDLRIAEIGPGMRFVERSRVLTLKLWQRERSVEAAGEGASIRDELTFEARVPGMGAVIEPGIRAFFGHRHRRLVEMFGSPKRA